MIDGVTKMTKGSNLELPAQGQWQLVLGWRDPEAMQDADLSGLLLSASGKVRSDGDFVFYNQPEGADGAVRHLGKVVTEAGTQDRLAVDLSSVPDDVSTIAVAASLDGIGTFGALEDVHLVLLDAGGTPFVRFDITDADSESAMLFGEIYRRDARWRFRAVGQGWSTGLAGLARDFGIDVAEDRTTDIETGMETEIVGYPDESGDDFVVELADPQLADASGSTSWEPVGMDPIEPPLIETSQLAVEGADSSGADTPVKALRRRGIPTRKRPPVRKTKPLILAEDPAWQASRLFSVSGVGAADEQEKRATSALLATMMAVRDFGRSVTARFGAPTGTIETYLEVGFPLGERTVHPDGVIRIARGDRIWTALLETKTGSGQLRTDQVEQYIDVARARGYDAVVTLSNEIASNIGDHPLAIDRRRLRKVTLHHLSWAEVLHDAQMQQSHRGVEDNVQSYILSEFIRYLEHPRSGAARFEDMGAAWITVREAIAAGTLRSTDRQVPAVTAAWEKLIRHQCLSLTADLGVTVAQVLPRRIANDRAARTAALVASLVADGTLGATLRVPGSAGHLVIVANLRTNQIQTSVEIPAPRDGGPARRLGWLLRQLKEAPDGLLIEVMFGGRIESRCEQIQDVRARQDLLIPDRAAEIRSFRLILNTPLGRKRSGVRGAFIPSVNTAVEGFYTQVVQTIKPWSPAAPRMPDEAAQEIIDAIDQQSDEAQD